MVIHAAESHDVEAQLAEAAAATEALARQYFGDAAYLRRELHEDRETGEMDTVFEVHYCFPDPDNDFDRLAALHEAFMHAFVRITGHPILRSVVLDTIPTDAD